MSEIKHIPGSVAFESNGQHFRATSTATEANSPYLRVLAKRKAERADLIAALHDLVMAVDMGTSPDYRALQEHQVMRTARAAIAKATGVQS